MINDMNMHVRSALGGSILKVAPLVGKQLTVDHVIPLALKFLRDEHPDVRLKIISTLPSYIFNPHFSFQLKQYFDPAKLIH